MAAPQNSKPEPCRIVGSISKFAGTVVGTAVVTGKRIIGSATPPTEHPPKKLGEKTMQAPAKRKKKATPGKKIKIPKTKKQKKKVMKRKGTGSSGKAGASKKKPAQSPAKETKGVTRRKKTTRRKTKKTAKSKGLSRSQGAI